MTPSDQYVIGVDGGTESVRAGLFDLSGRMLMAKSRPYETRFPRPGWAEQSPEEWWSALKEALGDLVASAGVEPGAIKALGCDTTCCTVVFLDQDMNPLRDALLWMDVRAAPEAADIAASGHPALKYNGFGNVSAEWMPPKALWVKRNQPEIFARAKTVCEYQDFINHRLTGRRAANISNASIRWYYDEDHGGWPESFYRDIGLEELPGLFPDPVLDMTEPLGTIRPELARELGLAPETVVAAGGVDAFVGMLGLGAVAAGRLAFIMGSSHLLLGMSPKEFHAQGIFGTYPHAVLRGMHTVEGGQISTGSVMNWFQSNFLHGGAAHDRQALAGLEAKAAQLPPGSQGLILLDSFQGNRTPLVDPNLRGALWGLSLSHGPEHIFRAIMEGVAYGSEFILRRFAQAGYEVDEIFACGGPTNSRLWMQIHADVSGVPICIPEVTDAPLMGSAMLAAVAAGLYPSVPAAAGEMVKMRRRIEPDPHSQDTYRFFVDRYIETYDKLGPLMHQMTAHIAGG